MMLTIKDATGNIRIHLTGCELRHRFRRAD
jgi:hypothetical protein